MNKKMVFLIGLFVVLLLSVGSVSAGFLSPMTLKTSSLLVISKFFDVVRINSWLFFKTSIKSWPNIPFEPVIKIFMNIT